MMDTFGGDVLGGGGMYFMYCKNIDRYDKVVLYLDVQQTNMFTGYTGAKRWHNNFTPWTCMYQV